MPFGMGVKAGGNNLIMHAWLWLVNGFFLFLLGGGQNERPKRTWALSGNGRDRYRPLTLYAFLPAFQRGTACLLPRMGLGLGRLMTFDWGNRVRRVDHFPIPPSIGPSKGFPCRTLTGAPSSSRQPRQGGNTNRCPCRRLPICGTRRRSRLRTCPRGPCIPSP